MLIFFRTMLRDKYKLLVIYTVASIGLLEMYIALFPTIKDQSASIDQLIRTMPPALFKAFGMDPASFSFGSFQTYLSSEYMSFLWPMLAIALAISIANYIAVREVDSGTIETLLSSPTRRSRIFTERFAAGLSIVSLFSIISLVGALPLAWLHGISFITENFVVASIGSTLFAATVYSIAVACSVIFSTKGRATMTASGILLLMYVVNVISGLNEDLENLRYFSLFNYFNGSELLGKAIYPEHMFLVFIGVIVLLFTFSFWWFKRRDYTA